MARPRKKDNERRLNAQQWFRFARTKGEPAAHCERWIVNAMAMLLDEIAVQHRLHAEHRDALRGDDEE